MSQWIDEYELLGQLGEGGMGVVYKAREPRLNKTVAIKVLHPDLARNDEGLERFRVEALLGANFRHPNCIRVEKLVETESYVAIIMEYVEGITVKELMRQHGGRLPIPVALRVFSQVLSGIDYAHQKGVLHRDIKPSNILVEQFGDDELAVKIMDFGIAKVVTEDKSRTSTDARMGTLLYMSPEHVMSPKYVDVRSDIYSLGATFFEMITGCAPFDGDLSSYELMERIVKRPPPLPSELNPDIPRALEIAILKAMAKRPDDRFQSCSEFKRALKGETAALEEDWDQIVSSLSDKTTDVEARFEELATIAEVADRSKRRIAVIAAVLVLILGMAVIGGSIALRMYQERTRQAETERLEAQEAARSEAERRIQSEREKQQKEQELAAQRQAAELERERRRQNELAAETAAQEAARRAAEQRAKAQQSERDRLNDAITRATQLDADMKYQPALDVIDSALVAVPSDIRPHVGQEIAAVSNLRTTIRTRMAMHEEEQRKAAEQQAQVAVLMNTLSVAEEKIRAGEFPEATAICDTVINNPQATREIKDRATRLKEESRIGMQQALKRGVSVGEVNEQQIKKKKDRKQ